MTTSWSSREREREKRKKERKRERERERENEELQQSMDLAFITYVMSIPGLQPR